MKTKIEEFLKSHYGFVLPDDGTVEYSDALAAERIANKLICRMHRWLVDKSYRDPSRVASRMISIWCLHYYVAVHWASVPQLATSEEHRRRVDYCADCVSKAVENCRGAKHKLFVA